MYFITEQIDEHIRYLIELLPNWLDIFKYKEKEYMKIKDKNIIDSKVKQFLEQKKQELIN